MLAFSAESCRKRNENDFSSFSRSEKCFLIASLLSCMREAFRDIIITEAETNKNVNYSRASNSVNFFLVIHSSANEHFFHLICIPS